ncbi:hypothetical protein F5Y10DRAFT_294264 [Nemania abortiva]|nr:hypothetical protein F5Y10DRAFT_294264 [Nemania abortiva]
MLNDASTELPTDPEVLFSKARDTFLASVSASERSLYAKCLSAGELLKQLESFAHFKKDRARWSKCFNRIKRFADHLEPYFEVVGIFVSSHPEWTAIAWGALRLVLQLAGNFGSHFEKFSQILEELCGQLPGYEKLVRLAPKELSSRFRHSLVRLYQDLFEFFKATVSVFTQKDGKIKRTPVVISQLLWKPFHVRYGNFLDRLAFHRSVCRDEREQMTTKLIIDEHGRAEGARIRQDKYHEDLEAYLEKVHKIDSEIQDSKARAMAAQTFLDIQKWIDPFPSSDQQNILDDAQTACERNTAQWIFQNEEFSQWSRSNDISSESSIHENSLFVIGKPGSGKTILAASVTDWLESNLESLRGDCCVARYFFSYRSAQLRQRLSAYTSILSQILHQHRDCEAIIELFSFIKASSKSKQASATSKELVALITGAAQKVSNLTLVLDGLDECDAPDQVIEDISRAIRGSRAKMIVFSRPSVQFLLSELGLRKISLGCSELRNDIQKYLHRRIQEAIRRRVLPPIENPNSTVEQLLGAADGMFIWARLMMDYINSPALTRQSRLVALRSVTRHETIEKMYSRILNLIMDKIRPEREMAKRVLAWVTWAARPLTTNEVMDIVQRYKTPLDQSNLLELDSEPDDELLSFQEAAVFVCASLVEVADNKLRLIHQSAAEFLKASSDETFDNDAAVEYFKFLKEEAHDQLATECFYYLQHRLPTRPLSGDMKLRAESTLIKNSNPFLEYALRFWGQHLQGSLPSPRIPRLEVAHDPRPGQAIDALKSILNSQTRVMAWLEAQYLLIGEDSTGILLNEFEQYLDAVNGGTDSQFLRTGDETDGNDWLRKLHKAFSELHADWGATLNQNSHHIWGDTTAFTKSEFWRSTGAVSVSSLASKSFGGLNYASKPLVSISKDSSCGELLAILSIWPTRDFEEFWSHAVESALHQAPCEGWTARYEVWCINSDTPSKVRELRIPLDSAEVRAQVIGAMRKKRVISVGSEYTGKPAFKWTLPFPAAIGSNLNLMVVLQTVYSMDKSASSDRAAVQLYRVQLRGGGHHPQQNFSSHNDDLQHERSYYSYVLSGDGKYVIRQDIKFLIPSILESPFINTLVAYEARSNTEAVVPMNSYRPHHPHASVHVCSIHPQLPFALLSLDEPGSPNRIKLWYFGQQLSKNVASISCTIDLTATLRKVDDGQLSACGRQNGDLKFSACGTQVIVSVSSLYGPQGAPVVIPLDQYALYTEVAGLLLQPESNDPASTARAQAQDCSSLQITKESMKGGRLVAAGNTASGLSISTLGGARTIDLGSQSILSFPESWGRMVSESGVTIRRTSPAREKNIKIVLNLVSQPYYTYGNPEEDSLPAVVFKDSRALLPPIHRTPTRFLGA